jgi:hypothetical protein
MATIGSIPAGTELWRGRSRLTGDPVVAIATGIGRASNNTKTGDMVQAWILAQNEAPGEARRSGLDASVCGACPHRPYDGWGTCYVNMWGPSGVYRAWRLGNYPPITPQIRNAIRFGKVRIGAYGDPLAVPARTWRGILPNDPADATGYTHSWKVTGAGSYKAFLMASVETRKEAAEAQAHGWRTFMVVQRGARIPKGMRWCPSDELNPGPKIPCAACGACNGARGSSPSIAIYAHGSPGKSFDPKRKRKDGPPIIKGTRNYDPVVRLHPTLHHQMQCAADDIGMPMKRWLEDAVRAKLNAG